ncbi:hypothetical protein JCM10212_002841 [Sporobolomyces blumeae]
MSALEKQHNATKADVYWLVGWSAILLWDTIVTLPETYRYAFRARWSPLKGRYGTVLIQTICMFMVVLYVPMDLCRSIFWFECFGLAFVLFICSCIMAIRCYALFERSRRILLFLVVLLLLQQIILTSTVTQLRPLVLKPGTALVADFQGCVAVATNETSRKMTVVFWSTALSFDSIVFLMSAFKSWKLARRAVQPTSVFRKMLRGGVHYYFVIVVSHALCVGFYAQTSQPYIQTFNTPASVVLSSLMCSRLVISLFSDVDRRNALVVDPTLDIRSNHGDAFGSPMSIPSFKSGSRKRDSNEYEKRQSQYSDDDGRRSETRIDMDASRTGRPRDDSRERDEKGSTRRNSIQSIFSNNSVSRDSAGRASALGSIAGIEPFGSRASSERGGGVSGQAQHRRTGSTSSRRSGRSRSNTHSNTNPTSNTTSGDYLPAFDGVVIRHEPREEPKMDARSVRSEGASRASTRDLTKSSSGRSGARDGTVSV